MRRDNVLVYYIVIGMFIFALAFGLVCRLTVLAAPEDPAPSTEENTTEVSTTEDHLSEEELDHILRVSKQFLRNTDIPEVATDTDAYDNSPYLTYDLDDSFIKDDASLNSALDDIYRILLSIRNVLLLFFFAFCIYWFDKKLHAIINKLFGGR